MVSILLLNTHVILKQKGISLHGCDCLEKNQKPFQISPDVTSKKVAELNSVLFADFHRILKKYQAVRKIVRSLTVCHIRFGTSSNIATSSFSYLMCDLYILPIVMFTLIPSQTSLNFHYCTLWKKILPVVLQLVILILLSSQILQIISLISSVKSSYESERI